MAEPKNEIPPLPAASASKNAADAQGKSVEEEVPPTPNTPVASSTKDDPVPPDLSTPSKQEQPGKTADAAPEPMDNAPLTAKKTGDGKDALEQPETPRNVEIQKPADPAPPKEEPVTPAPAPETPQPAPVATPELNLTPTPAPSPSPSAESPAGTLYPIPFSGPRRMSDPENREAPSPIPTPPPSENRRPAGAGEPVTHVVRRGENFFSISQRYYATGRWYLALWDANKDVAKTPEDLYVGTEIRIPAPETLRRDLIVSSRGKSGSSPNLAAIPPGSDAVATKDLQASRASQRLDGSKLLAAGDATSIKSKDSANLPRAETAALRATRYYVVKKANETLRSIASRELNDSDRDGEILDLNRDQLEDSNGLLSVGMKLKLPSQSALK